MQPARSSQLSPRRGFTLIELLLAVAIAAVVTALAWSLLSSTSGALERVTERDRGPGAAAQAVDRIRDELGRLFLPPDDPACALELSEAGATPARLVFCSMEVVARTPDLTLAEPRRVEYTLLPADGGKDALARISERLSGEIVRETNMVLQPCAAFRVEFGDGAAWHAQWPAETGEPVPRVARVTIQSRPDEDAASAEFWLPVGHSITSRLLRSGSVQGPE